MNKKVFVLLLVMTLIIAGCSKEEPLTLKEQFEQASTGEFVIDEAGIYGEVDKLKVFEGDIYVKVDGVTLQNINIIGNLVLAEEIGEGDVELIDLDISGTVYIYGGGENSVRYRRTKSKHTLVYKPYKPVRVVVDKESKIDKITVQSSVTLEGDTISKISIEPKEKNVDVNLSGIFKDVEVKATSKVVILEKTHVETLVIDKDAKNTELSGNGEIDNVEINAEKVNINVQVKNTYTNNNIEQYMMNNEVVDLVVDPEEIYHTADTWKVGMPWNPEWGEEPEGAWHPESGIPWDPAWGAEPDDFYSTDKGESEDEVVDLVVDLEEIYHTADTWEVGMPWNPEWGEEPEGAWHPESGIPWDPAWGAEPDDFYPTDEGEPEDEVVDEANLEFLICTYNAISNPASLEITISLSKPGIVYYVFEDLSVMFGLEYLPSIGQIMQGNNALGNPDPKAAPDTGDDEMEFFSVALVSGQIQVDVAGKEYKIVIYGPTFFGNDHQSSAEKTFPEAPTGINGSFVAVDEEGNKIIKQ